MGFGFLLFIIKRHNYPIGIGHGYTLLKEIDYHPREKLARSNWHDDF